MSFPIVPVFETLKFVSAGCFGLAALQDAALRLVPNGVPLAIAALGAALRLMDGNLPAGLLAGVAVFLVAAWCWRRGWLGGADVKLFGAGALLVPPAAAFGFVLSACLAGGVLAACWRGWSGWSAAACAAAARCRMPSRSAPEPASPCCGPDRCCFALPCSR